MFNLPGRDGDRARRSRVLVNIAQIAESSAVVTQVSVRAACEPSFNMRPGVFVGAAPRHDADVPSRNTIEFLVATPHLRQVSLRLAGRSDVIGFGDDRQQIGSQPVQVNALAAK